MNTAAIRWLRWAAKAGMVFALIYWVGMSSTNFVALPVGVGANPGEHTRLLISSVLDPINMSMHGFMVSAVLFVGCEIALHLDRQYRDGPEE